MATTIHYTIYPTKKTQALSRNECVRINRCLAKSREPSKPASFSGTGPRESGGKNH